METNLKEEIRRLSARIAQATRNGRDELASRLSQARAALTGQLVTEYGIWTLVDTSGEVRFVTHEEFHRHFERQEQSLPPRESDAA